jgi:hypothetical protein
LFPSKETNPPVAGFEALSGDPAPIFSAEVQPSGKVGLSHIACEVLGKSDDRILINNDNGGIFGSPVQNLL